MPRELEQVLGHINQGLVIYFTLEVLVKLVGLGPNRWGRLSWGVHAHLTAAVRTLISV